MDLLESGPHVLPRAGRPAGRPPPRPHWQTSAAQMRPARLPRHLVYRRTIHSRIRPARAFPVATGPEQPAYPRSRGDTPDCLESYATSPRTLEIPPPPRTRPEPGSCPPASLHVVRP